METQSANQTHDQQTTGPARDSVHEPVRIFLQWHGDAEPGDYIDPPDASDVTWCADRIFRHDVEYIRADRVQILIDALDGLAMPCTRADYTVARLDEVVSRLAKSALDDFANVEVRNPHPKQP
jgi:hypothetical protein